MRRCWVDAWFIFCKCFFLSGSFQITLSIRYILLDKVWTPFGQNCTNTSWQTFNKVLETFLRDLVPFWHESITQLLQICRLHIYNANLPFYHIPKVLYWFAICWQWYDTLSYLNYLSEDGTLWSLMHEHSQQKYWGRLQCSNDCY